MDAEPLKASYWPAFCQPGPAWCCPRVSPRRAALLLCALCHRRQQSVEFVVAPYEADAQLAHLACLPQEEGGVAAVVTEDSDLAAYGCPRLLFKCDT